MRLLSLLLLIPAVALGVLTCDLRDDPIAHPNIVSIDVSIYTPSDSDPQSQADPRMYGEFWVGADFDGRTPLSTMPLLVGATSYPYGNIITLPTHTWALYTIRLDSSIPEVDLMAVGHPAFPFPGFMFGFNLSGAIIHYAKWYESRPASETDAPFVVYYVALDSARRDFQALTYDDAGGSNYGLVAYMPAAPEPQTWLLAGLGFALCATGRRR